MSFYKLYRRRTDYDNMLYKIDRIRYPNYYARKDRKAKKALRNIMLSNLLIKSMLPKGVFNQ